MHRPSDTFEAFVGNEKVITTRVLNVLEKEYQLNGEFADYADTNVGPLWRQTLEKNFLPTLRKEFNSNSFYDATLQGYIANSLNVVFPGMPLIENISLKINQELDKIPTSPINASFASVLATNNPQSKLSVPPPDTRIALENTTPLGLDYRGVEFTTGYSTLNDYWSNIPYPGMTSPSVIPATLKDSIIGGLEGYLSNNPLESVYNPIGAGSITTTDLSPSEAINFSDPFGSGFVLGQIPFPNLGDTDTYSISLIGERLNGLTTFDLKTMSNGDYIDPKFTPSFEKENSDPDGGRSSLTRTFNPAY